MAAYYDEKLKEYAIVDKETGLVEKYVKAGNPFEAMAIYRSSLKKEDN